MSMKKIKYQIKLSNRWDNEADIQPIEIEKETSKSVWIDGNRTLKRSSYWNFYDSFKEAKLVLLEAQRARIKRLQEALKKAESVLDDIKKLSPDAT